MADQWEYSRLFVDFMKDDLGHSHNDEGWAKLDALGLEGWEAVGMAPHVQTLAVASAPIATFGVYVLLKRPKQS